MLWQIYWLWQYGKIQGLIFNFNTVPKIPENAKLIWYWLDFWFTNDPTAMTGVYLYDKDLYLDEIIYQTQLTNNDIVNKFKSLWIKNNDDIVWDSSEPKSIEEIYRAWFNIKGATKWPDSIIFWIDLLKQYTINITETSTNIIKEFKHYKRALDKEGKALNKPIDVYNHAIDWIRYICMEKLKKQITPNIYIW